MGVLGGGQVGSPSLDALAGPWACGSGEVQPEGPVLRKLRTRAAALAALFRRLPRDIAQLYIDNWLEEVAAWAMGPADDAVAREEAEAAARFGSGHNGAPPPPPRRATQDEVAAFLVAAAARCDPAALAGG